MYKHCRSCDKKTLVVWGHCSVCLRKALDDDPLALDTLERKIAEIEIQAQLDMHPEISDEDGDPI